MATCDQIDKKVQLESFIKYPYEIYLIPNRDTIYTCQWSNTQKH